MTDGEHRATSEPIAESQWQPPAIEPVFDPEEPNRAFLRFQGIPEGDEQDFTMLVASRFFAHFAFERWNAGQVGGSYLTRQTDIANRGVWLYTDASSPARLSEQVAELIKRYDAFRDPEDDYVEHRVAFITQEVRRRLAKSALEAESD